MALCLGGSLALRRPLHGLVCALSFVVIKGGSMSALETLYLLESMLQMGVWEAQAGAQGDVEHAGAAILHIHSGNKSNQS